MRLARTSLVVLSAALAACGGEPPAKPAAPAPSPAPAPAPAPAPVPAAPKPESPKPAPAKPAARVTKDASGRDWASHMGDIPFALDPSAAMAAATKAGRRMMLYFTSPG